MAEVAFVQPSEITETTIIGGNVDIDKYLFCVQNAQLSVIEPLLGTELFDYLITNFETLAGDYLTLMTDYIKPIVKNETVAMYIEISPYILDNGGLFKNAPDNAEIVDKEEAQYLAGKYHNLAQMYINRFNKWICKNPLTEYKTVQDEVNAQKYNKVTAGWYFGSNVTLNNDDLKY